MTARAAAARPAGGAGRAARPARSLLPLSVALGITGLTVGLLQLLIVPALPDVGERLGASPTAQGWLVTATLLAQAVLTPLSGRLGDLRGRRRMLLVCIGSACAGSLLGAVTSSFPLLLLARVMQGTTGGVLPLALGLLREKVPAERLTVAMALFSGTLGLGTGLGPVLAGRLTEHGGNYHHVLLVAAAMTALSLGLLAATLPSRDARRTGSVDWLGGGLLGGGLALLLLALSIGADSSWLSAPVLGCVAAGAAALATWTAQERSTAAPIVPLRLLRSRVVVDANVAALCTGVAMLVVFLGVFELVQAQAVQAGYGFGASPLHAAAVYVLPATASSIVVVPLGGWIAGRIGARAVLVLAQAVATGGFVLLAAVHDEPWQVLAGGLVVNVGIGLAYAALPALLVGAVAPGDTSVANAVNALARWIGTAIGSAFVLTLLATATIHGSAVAREGAFVLAFAAGAVTSALGAAVTWLGARRPEASRR